MRCWCSSCYWPGLNVRRVRRILAGTRRPTHNVSRFMTTTSAAGSTKPEGVTQPSLIRAIGRVSLTAAIVNGVIGSGIFGLPSTIAALTGAWSPVVVRVAGACVFVVLLCFAEVSSRFDQAGGPYLYAREAFGPIVGFQVGWLLLVSRLLGCAAALNILVVYLAPLVPAVATTAGRALTMTGAIAIATAINVTGVRIATWTTNVFTVAKMLPLLLLIVLGLPVINSDVLAAQAVTSPDWSEAVLLMVFAYGGFESMIVAAGEARRPREDTAAALITAGAIVTLIYCLLQLVIVGVLPDAARSSAPVASALREVIGASGMTLGSLAVVLSVYGWLTGFTLMMPRVLYSMATHGELPAVVARVHPRLRTPYIAIVANAVIALGMALYSSFAEAAAFAAIARLVVFAVTCAALVMLRRAQGPSTGFRLPAGTMFAIAGTAFSIWLLSTRSSHQLAITFGIIASGVVVRGLGRNR
jgi:basic amino acid/polyamine antiporter, APA family